MGSRECGCGAEASVEEQASGMQETSCGCGPKPGSEALPGACGIGCMPTAAGHAADAPFAPGAAVADDTPC